MEEEQKKVSGAAALPKVGWKGMLALAFGILFFAGVFATVQGAEWLKAFDYSTLIGKFGTMKDPAKATFVGMGGVSARGGFIFALSLIPSVMLAIGVVDVLDHYGALSAAQKLMTPLFKPLMDVPGLVGLGSLVSHTILGSDSADGVEMVPASAVSGVEIDEGARKVRIAVGDEVKKYQFKEKDCFGGDHEEALRDFFRFLRGIRG